MGQFPNSYPSDSTNRFHSGDTAMFDEYGVKHVNPFDYDNFTVEEQPSRSYQSKSDYDEEQFAKVYLEHKKSFMRKAEYEGNIKLAEKYARQIEALEILMEKTKDDLDEQLSLELIMSLDATQIDSIISQERVKKEASRAERLTKALKRHSENTARDGVPPFFVP